MINWEADTLQYQNDDNIYLISTNTTPSMETSSNSLLNYVTEVESVEVSFIRVYLQSI